MLSCRIKGIFSGIELQTESEVRFLCFRNSNCVTVWLQTYSAGSVGAKSLCSDSKLMLWRNKRPCRCWHFITLLLFLVLRPNSFLSVVGPNIPLWVVSHSIPRVCETVCSMPSLKLVCKWMFWIFNLALRPRCSSTDSQRVGVKLTTMLLGTCRIGSDDGAGQLAACKSLSASFHKLINRGSGIQKDNEKIIHSLPALFNSSCFIKKKEKHPHQQFSASGL